MGLFIVLVGGMAVFKRMAYDDYVQRVLKTIPHTKTSDGGVTARFGWPVNGELRAFLALSEALMDRCRFVDFLTRQRGVKLIS